MKILKEIKEKNMNITKEEIEQFKKDCKARNLRLPNPCTDEWCIEQIKEIYKDIYENEELLNENS